MPFTDDDLKRLKDYYEDPKRGDIPLKWKALLARLRAAEKHIGALGKLKTKDQDPFLLLEIVATGKDWDEAAGKDK